jgi:drug/metabolite transporter (DMT)-like permease
MSVNRSTTAGATDGDANRSSGPAPLAVSGVGIAAAAGSLFCWTVTPLFVEYLTGCLDLWASNGWRYGIAALVWLPYLLWMLSRRQVAGWIWRRALWPAFFSTTAQIAFVGAFYYTGPGMLTFGMRMQIVATAVGAAILFPAERLVIRRPSFLAGMAAVVVGVVGVALYAPAEVTGVVTGGLEGAPRESNLIGMLLAAASGVGYACYGMAVRRCLAGVSAKLSFSVISLYVGGSLLVLMTIFSANPVEQLVALDGTAWTAMAVSIVFGLAAGHVIYFTAMAKLGVAQATGVVQLQPFTVAAASWFVFGEMLTAPQLVCGTVAVAGAAMMLYTQHAMARRRRVDPARELDQLPIDEVVALEEAELAGRAEAAPEPPRR